MTREQLERMTHAEREAYIKKLQNEILAMLGAPVETETPEPPVKPKAKRSKRIERFDDLSDDAQISQLRGLWGAA